MSVLDSSTNAESAAAQIRQAGHSGVGRYYSSAHWKRLTRPEAVALSAAGLDVFAVFEDAASPELTFEHGVRDAQIAMMQAAAVGQPDGTAIYFALDTDINTSALQGVRAYFQGVTSTLAGKFKIGVYSDGLVCGTLLDEGVCSFAWLSSSSSFPLTKQFYASKRWAIAQSVKTVTLGSVTFDLNETDGDFGGFRVNVAATEMAHAAVMVESAVPESSMGVGDDASMPWMDWMRGHVGEIQRTGAVPTDFTREIFAHTTFPLTDFTPESCAATVCAALEETGYTSTHRADAVSFVNYGEPCELTKGCVVVFQWGEGGGHHVDFCDEIVDDDTVRGLGGNQGHELQDTNFLRKYIIATRWPVRSQQ